METTEFAVSLRLGLTRELGIQLAEVVFSRRVI